MNFAIPQVINLIHQASHHYVVHNILLLNDYNVNLYIYINYNFLKEYITGLFVLKFKEPVFFLIFF